MFEQDLTREFFDWKFQKEKQEHMDGFSAEFLPQIQLEIKGLKDVVINKMGLFGSKLGDVVDKTIMKHIKTINVENDIKNAVDAAINEAIKDYFKVIMKERIKTTVFNALEKVFKEKPNE